MPLCCLQALVAHKLSGGKRLGLLQALRDAQMRGAALPFLQGLVADTVCEQVERREGYQVSRQVVHPKLLFKETPGLGEPRVISIPKGKHVQAGAGSSSCSRVPSTPHAASAAAAAGGKGSSSSVGGSGHCSRLPSDSKAASAAAAAGRTGSNSAPTHLLGKAAGSKGSSRSAEASSSLTSQGSLACLPRQSFAKGSSWATEGSSTDLSPENQEGPAPAQPAAADVSGDSIASYRGLIGTEVEPEVHILHSGQHDLATAWGDANRNLYVDVSRPKVGLCCEKHNPTLLHCTLR